MSDQIDSSPDSLSESDQLTEHFALHELRLPADKAEQYGFPETPYPEEWVTSRALPLCQAAEKLRVLLGNSRVHIISGYRPPAYDAARIAAGHTDVSSVSQHGQGRAMDVQVDGCTANEVYEAALALWHEGVFRGVGVYDNFVHVDIRTGEKSLWDKRSGKGGSGD